MLAFPVSGVCLTSYRSATKGSEDWKNSAEATRRSSGTRYTTAARLNCMHPIYHREMAIMMEKIINSCNWMKMAG